MVLRYLYFLFIAASFFNNFRTKNFKFPYLRNTFRGPSQLDGPNGISTTGKRKDDADLTRCASEYYEKLLH